MMDHGRLVVVSNRLPVTIDESDGNFTLRNSSGGLVSALVPILKKRSGAWVGCTGTDFDDRAAGLLTESGSSLGCTLEPVFLTAAERYAYYRGFSNEIIWPLFHGLPSQCRFNRVYWDGYGSANEKFARAVERVADDETFIWIHDYHLMLLAGVLRDRGMQHRLAYFHHIPFPSPDVFEILPWRMEILRALLQFDHLGFQTHRDRRNFIGCVESVMKNVHISTHDGHIAVRGFGRRSTVGVHPISVDYKQYAAWGTEEAVTESAYALRHALGTCIVLGVDRLDYTKGIPERLTAFEKLLESRTDLHGRVTLLQIVVPSREEISEYQQLKLRIETLVSRINSRYGNPGWIPIQYFYRSVSRIELSSYYRAADVALVTPLRDGMNLVAKEFCASRVDNQGVLVLSEFAGAAEELKCGAVMVNPHDTNALAMSIYNALQMDGSTQRRRMERMRSQLRANDVFYWSGSFMSACNRLPAGAPDEVSADCVPA